MHCCTADEHLAQASENNVIDLLFTYTINVFIETFGSCYACL